MTVKQLIELLEDIPSDVEVRLMTQEARPFENSVCGIALASEMDDLMDDDEEEVDGYRPHGLSAGDECVFIVEGEQLGYGTKLAWQVYRQH